MVFLAVLWPHQIRQAMLGKLREQWPRARVTEVRCWDRRSNTTWLGVHLWVPPHETSLIWAPGEPLLHALALQGAWVSFGASVRSGGPQMRKDIIRRFYNGGLYLKLTLEALRRDTYFLFYWAVRTVRTKGAVTNQIHYHTVPALGVQLHDLTLQPWSLQDIPNVTKDLISLKSPGVATITARGSAGRS